MSKDCILLSCIAQLIFIADSESIIPIGLIS